MPTKRLLESINWFTYCIDNRNQMGRFHIPQDNCYLTRKSRLHPNSESPNSIKIWHFKLFFNYRDGIAAFLAILKWNRKVGWTWWFGNWNITLINTFLTILIIFLPSRIKKIQTNSNDFIFLCNCNFKYENSFVVQVIWISSATVMVVSKQ